MPLNIGSVEALATTVNHFYPDLGNAFVEMFELHRDTELDDWITQMFRPMQLDGAYTSEQTWGQPAMPGPLMRGEYITDSGFDEFVITYYVHDYGTDRYTWHINDRQDSRAPQDLRDRVQQAAVRLALYQEYVLPELLTGSIGSFIHPDASLTNIFGGTGMFADAHSYAGQTLDNSYAGSGTDSAGVIDDLFGVRQTFREMVDSVGEPYWNRNKIGKMKWCVVCPPEMEQVFDNVMESEMVLQDGALSATSNYLKKILGPNVELHVFERLTDADNWYVILRSESADGMRPFVWGERKGIEQKTWLMENSDWAKEHHKEGLQWWFRFLTGVGIPFCGIEVNN